MTFTSFVEGYVLKTSAAEILFWEGVINGYICWPLMDANHALKYDLHTNQYNFTSHRNEAELQDLKIRHPHWC